MIYLNSFKSKDHKNAIYFAPKYVNFNFFIQKYVRECKYTYHVFLLLLSSGNLYVKYCRKIVYKKHR